MTSTLRCLRVLELLAEDPFELSLTDLSATLQLPKASAHRLCATLVAAGLVEQDLRTRHYILGPKALWVGSGYLRHSAVYRAAFFPMQELARHVPGTVQLGVRLEDEVLFIHSVGYPGSPHAFADVGLRRALHATASGKVFLAAMSESDVKRVFKAGCERYTDRTITSLARMQSELEEVRRKDYAWNTEELLPGYWVLAAPVLARGGEAAAAISLTMSIQHMTAQNEAEYAARLRDACQKASLQLGYASLRG
jgi:DNA-binding IclR family transcriptional regulator